MPHFSVDQIGAVTLTALVRHGATRDIAASVAAAVSAAEANGNRICGLAYVESYCVQLASRRVDGEAEPVVTLTRPGAVRVDGRMGFAQPAFEAGFDAACASARANGTCGYAVEHTHTCTALGYFTEQFAREGLLAIGATNATARVSPPGGSIPVLGTNPLAMAVPDGDGGVAFQFDFSTSAVALGTVTAAAAAGETIPPGWAVDPDGQPTTDPSAALEGSLSSAGGYRGFGLGLMVEVLAAALTGTRLSVDVPPLKAAEGPPHDLGQFYVVIDPSAYSGDLFAERLAGLADAVGSQPGSRLPGSRRSPAAEVEVDAALWERVLDLAGG